MKRKKVRILLLSCLIELEIIGLLLLNIRNKEAQRAGSVGGVSVVGQNEIINNPDSKLGFFYELNPLSIEEDLYQPPWLGYKPVISINSDGLNDRFDYDNVKAPDTYRIVMLGDSWTYGRYVNTSDNFSETLEDLLNETLSCDRFKKFEVINLGVPSYDIAYSVERFRLRGEKYKPDLIIWLLIENDFSEINEFLKKRVNEYLSQLGKEKSSPGESHQDQILDILSKPPYSPQVEAWIQALEDQKKEISKDDLMNYQERALATINDYHKGEILLVTIPKTSPIGEPATGVVKNFVGSRKGALLLENMVDMRAEDLTLEDQHPNVGGHKRLAGDIYSFLNTNKVIKCD